MKTICKYSLSAGDKIEIEMPIDAEILAIQTQYGEPEIWALVDTALHSRTYTFYVRATDYPFTGVEGRYLGTFQMNGGATVLHVFDERKDDTWRLMRKTSKSSI